MTTRGHFGPLFRSSVSWAECFGGAYLHMGRGASALSGAGFQKRGTAHLADIDNFRRQRGKSEKKLVRYGVVTVVIWLISVVSCIVARYHENAMLFHARAEL